MTKALRSLCLALLLLPAACSSWDPTEWNKREKGTAAGGALGAGLGAIVGSQSGNTVEGALIGGAAGAGTGALIGHELDDRNESSRYRYDRDYDKEREIRRRERELERRERELDRRRERY